MDPQAQPQPQLPVSPEPRPVSGGEMVPVMAETMTVPAQPEVAPVPGGSPAPPPVVAQAQPAATSLTPAVPIPVTSPVAASQAVVGPVIAEDVDVIEKEWVDRAQEIVRATANDPYAEEEAVEDLQIDYLKKRYGKEIKKPEPGK